MARLLSFYTLVYSRKSFHRIVTQVVALAADNQAYQAVHRPQTSALGKADDNNDGDKDANAFLTLFNQLINQFLRNGGRLDDADKALRAAAHLIRQTDSMCDGQPCELCTIVTRPTRRQNQYVRYNV